MKMLGKLLMAKELITQLLIYWIIHIENYKLVAKDLSKQQALDVDWKENNKLIKTLKIWIEQETHFLRKEINCFVFPQAIVKVLRVCFIKSMDSN